MTSLRPSWNGRPSASVMWRIETAAGSTPRSGTFASVPVARFGTFTTT
jgi:hypothetical protein